MFLYLLSNLFLVVYLCFVSNNENYYFFCFFVVICFFICYTYEDERGLITFYVIPPFCFNHPPSHHRLYLVLSSVDYFVLFHPSIGCFFFLLILVWTFFIFIHIYHFLFFTYKEVFLFIFHISKRTNYPIHYCIGKIRPLLI